MGEMPEPCAMGAEALHHRVAVEAANIGQRADARAAKARPRGGAHAPENRDRLVAQEGLGIALADHREPARLVEIGGDLGEELVVREADRGGHPDLGLDLPGEPRHQNGGWCVVQPLGAAEIEERLVERERLDQRGQRIHQRPDLCRDLGVIADAGRDHDGVGTELAGLKHRHGGAHARDPGDIATGGHHAALPASHDQGF